MGSESKCKGRRNNGMLQKFKVHNLEGERVDQNEIFQEKFQFSWF